MAVFLRGLGRASWTSATLRSRSGARGFVSSLNWKLKESNAGNPLADEGKHRDESVQKAKEGKGHWKPELASDSEEVLAADRHVRNDSSEQGMKELQKETEKHAEQKHHEPLSVSELAE